MAELLRLLLVRGFGVLIVDAFFAGVLVTEFVMSPKGAESRFIASIAAVAFSTSDPSPDGIRSNLRRFTVCFAKVDVLTLGAGLIVSNTHSSSSSVLLISLNVSS